MEDVKLTAHRGLNGHLFQAIDLAARDLCGVFRQAEDQEDFAERWWKLACHGLLPQVLAEADVYIDYFTKEADVAEKTAASERSTSFNRWAKEATKAGGGAAHAFSKVPKGWRATVVPGGSHPGQGIGTTSCPQAVVDAELDKWGKIWRTDQALLEEELPPWPVFEAVVPIFGEEVREVCKTYKWWCGISIHQLHPKHLSLLSDQCMFVLAYLMYCMELHGKWASSMASFVFFLLGKPTGGFRTIGLLPDLYRIWGKIRMPVVRAWGASVPRAFFAAGPGRGTEDAVGRVLMATEGADLSVEEAACVILDIDKCYENVRHAKLVKAASQHGFPLRILRMCLHMYRAPRTVS